MKKMEHVKKVNLVAAVFFAVMATVYGMMMYGNKPWYDELYTYYYFISRGPVYAAIHWPVPNNHVGYSVLSACLDLIKDPYIRLRGISYIAAVANLVLIYSFSARFMEKTLALGVSMLYAGAGLVHRLSIQGRGYTLAVTCFIIVMIMFHDICTGKRDDKSRYIWMVIALTYGLYIVPSSVYWVIPACMVAGIYVLIRKKYDALKKMFLSGILAAFITFGLYTTIWLSIGANLVSKDSASAYYGLHQLKVLFKAPLLSFKTGVEYMLASPYIQSIDRLDCIKGMPEYLSVLFDNFYSGMGVIIFILCVLFVIYSAAEAFMNKKGEDDRLFADLFIAVCLLIVPVMLLVQSVHPYKRVLSFYMFPIAFAAVYMIGHMLKTVPDGRTGKVGYDRIICNTVMIICACVCLLSVASGANRAPLADKENEIKEVLDMTDVSSIDNIFYMDDYQKYVLKFYYDAAPVESQTVEDADWVLLPNELTDPGYEQPVWPVMYAYDEGMLDYVYSSFDTVAVNEEYTLLRRTVDRH